MKTALAFVVSLALAACGSTLPPNTTTSGGATSGGGTTGSSTTTTSGTTTTGAASTGGTTGTVYPPPCPSNGFVCPSGSVKAGQVYPATSPANCGTSPGQTFPDLELMGGGVLNFNTTETMDQLPVSPNSIHIHDLFCSGFDFVFIDVSTVWCPHCNDEANQLPGRAGSGYSSNSLVQTWLNAKGLVFSVLVQGNTSASATTADLTTWINQYKVPYSMSLDQNQDLAAGLSLAGWPENIIVDLRDMHVVTTVPGADNHFYTTYCRILNIANCPPPAQ
jgi:hypothetical protein